MNRLAPIRRFLFSRSKKHQRILVLAFGLLGFLAPLMYGYQFGFPVPHVHDELSYVFAADTFAHGRLTNPTPAEWENFEAPHILVRPSYTSKYPPMQGFFLMIGQLLFGRPVFGLWLSCGFFAAALYWMLAAWTRPKWAIIGTLLMISLIGVHHYWAQSFWGGMVAAGGAALFFGAFRRLFKNLSTGLTVLMTLGGIILINSRPFEGAVTMLPALFVLLVWVLRDKSHPVMLKFSRIILPGLLLTGLTLSWMAYYNYRLTGSPLRFAYTEHQSQYFSTPLFIFQKPTESALQGSPRLQKLYRILNSSSLIKDLDEFKLPRNVYLYPVYAVVFLLFFLPYSFLGPPLLVFLFVATPLVARNKWMRLIVATVVFTIVCMSFATYWDNAHYAAPLTSCYFLLIAEGMRYFLASRKTRLQRKIVIYLLVFLSSFSVMYKWWDEITEKRAPKEIPQVNLNLTEPAEFKIPERMTFLKPVLEETALKSPDNYLILMSYDKTYSVHDEVVYNRADLENAKIIWATDLGPEKNQALLEHYRDRKVLVFYLRGGNFKITPLARNKTSD
jgi:hypothetical protein